MKLLLFPLFLVRKLAETLVLFIILAAAAPAVALICLWDEYEGKE